jgi:hypothetical protein
MQSVASRPARRSPSAKVKQKDFERFHDSLDYMTGAPEDEALAGMELSQIVVQVMARLDRGDFAFEFSVGHHYKTWEEVPTQGDISFTYRLNEHVGAALELLRLAGEHVSTDDDAAIVSAAYCMPGLLAGRNRLAEILRSQAVKRLSSQKS